jgi:hypothetical protein
MQKSIRSSMLAIFFMVCIFTPMLNAQRTRPEPATEEPIADAYTQAKIDAKENISEIKWLGCGCVGSVYAVGIAYLWGVSPDQSRLIGKSSEYVFTYTKAYKSNVRSIRTTYALIGCSVSGALAVTGCIIAMSQEECDPSCGLDETCADPLGLNSCMENFEGMGCYEPNVGCKSPESCQDEADCATGNNDNCNAGDGCSSGDGCGSSSTSANNSCGGSAEYLTK